MLLLALGCAAPVEMDLSRQGPLAAEALVQAPEAGRLWIELVAPGLEPQRTPPVEVAPGPVEVDVVGMRGDTDYRLCAVVELEDGRRLESQPQVWTTNTPTQPVPDVVAYGETEGITLFAPAPRGKGAVLDGAFLVGVDPQGEVVWEYTPEDLTKAGKDRLITDLGGGEYLVLTGKVETITPAGQLLEIVEAPNRIHHDALRLSNGNTLALVGDTRDLYVQTFDEVVTVTGDAILELDPDGEILWEWNSFDHLDIERWPGELSRTPAQGIIYSWTHANSLQLIEDEQVVVMSLRHQNQVLAIERSTGEILWTLGHEGDFELAQGSWFTSQHAARLEGDQMLLVDNGNDAGLETRVATYTLDFEAMTAEVEWAWPLGWELTSMGEADRLEGGNLLVTAGGDREERPAEILEVDPQVEVVWGLEIAGDDFIYRGERVHWLEPLEP